MRITKYVVASYGAPFGSGVQNEKWLHTREQAESEAKRRLGLVRLNTRARQTVWESTGSGAPTRQHENSTWKCVHVTEYSKVPPSHPEYGRSGGVRIWAMECSPEPFVNPFEPRLRACRG